MSAAALIPISANGQFAEPVRGALSGNSLLTVMLAMAALLLLLAFGALIATARVLLGPIFALIGTLFRLLLVLGAAVAIIVMVLSGSAHAAGPTAGGAARPHTGALP